MGTEDPVRQVEDRIVGVRFRVKESKRHQRHGEILLIAEVHEPELFDNAVKSLDGFKLFSNDLSSEVRDALCSALEETHSVVQKKDQEIAELVDELTMANARIEELESLLRNIGQDLGLDGE